VNLLLQRSKRQKPFCTHIDKVKPFVADEMPKSWITMAVQDDRAGQLPPEERLSPDDEGARTLKGGVQRAVDEDVSTAIAGMPAETFRSPRPRRQAGRPQCYLD